MLEGGMTDEISTRTWAAKVYERFLKEYFPGKMGVDLENRYCIPKIKPFTGNFDYMLQFEFLIGNKKYINFAVTKNDLIALREQLYEYL